MPDVLPDQPQVVTIPTGLPDLLDSEVTGDQLTLDQFAIADLKLA